MPNTDFHEKIIQIDARSKRNEDDLKIIKPAVEKNTKVNYAQKQIFERIDGSLESFDNGLAEVTADLKALIRYFLGGIIGIIVILGGLVVWFIQFVVANI